MKRYAQKTAHVLIDRAMAALGLRVDMKTDPRIMRSVLREMKLDDFLPNHAAMRVVLKKAAVKPQRLQPMFSSIREGIVSKHPAVLEYIETALARKWLQPSEHAVRAVHVAYLLEALTVAMCNSHDFFIEAYDHYRAKDRARGIDPLHTVSTFFHCLLATRHVFGTVKALSVDPTMIFFRMQRGLPDAPLSDAEAKKLLKEKKINFLEYRLVSPVRKGGIKRIDELIRINIYEAGISEYKKGFHLNALCSHELSEDIRRNPPVAAFKRKSVHPVHATDALYDSLAEQNTLFPSVGFSQQWTSLYIAWNMAFVLGNLDDLDLLIPKLLIPSVIDADSEDFMGARIISLWLSINHVFFRKYEKLCLKAPRNAIEMAKAWGSINASYARNLAKRETHEDVSELSKSYHRFFSHPLASFFRMAAHFW